MRKLLFSKIIHRRPAAGRLGLIGPQQADCRPGWHAAACGWSGHVARGGGSGLSACAPLSAYRPPIGQLLADRVLPPRARLAGCSLRPYPPLPPFFFSPSSLLLLFFSVLTFSSLYTKMPPIYTPK